MYSFQDAVATIRRTGTEYQYQLVVTRAYEEGEEQLLDEDAESKAVVLYLSYLLIVKQRMTSAFFSSIRACNSALGLWTGTPPVRGRTLVGRKVTAGSLLVAKYVPDFDSLVFIY